MAKANIETKDGTKIMIEGTPEEISKLMNIYQNKDVPQASKSESKKHSKEKTNSKPTVTDTVREILAEGFFDKPKSLSEVKQGLQEQGTIIPITTLSGVVLSLVKNKELRRIKQDKKWVYAKR